MGPPGPWIVTSPASAFSALEVELQPPALEKCTYNAVALSGLPVVRVSSPRMTLYDDLVQTFARSRPGSWMFVHVFNPLDRFLMRATKARLNTGFGSRFRSNGVLLGCTGARTGVERHVPLLATPVGSDFVLIASKGGAPTHPAWYRNLLANPECTLTVSGRVLRCTAAVENYAGYADYQRRTSRRIPVMVLTARDI
jgi:F420H(2)-dependent quinone reductase